MVKFSGSTTKLLFKLTDSRVAEVTGISEVGVISVDIRRNTDGVGRLLGCF